MALAPIIGHERAHHPSSSRLDRPQRTGSAEVLARAPKVAAHLTEVAQAPDGSRLYLGLRPLRRSPPPGAWKKPPREDHPPRADRPAPTGRRCLSRGRDAGRVPRSGPHGRGRGRDRRGRHVALPGEDDRRNASSHAIARTERAPRRGERARDRPALEAAYDGSLATAERRRLTCDQRIDMALRDIAGKAAGRRCTSCSAAPARTGCASTRAK
jgi:hypothetical protein